MPLLPLFAGHTVEPISDPWTEALAPALRGQPPPLERLALDRGAHAAVAARCLLATGHLAEARRAQARARALGHPDAAALAWLLDRREEPIGADGAPIEQADAWADRAWRELTRGRPALAEDAARRVLDLVPEHAEARLLLAGPPRPLPPPLRPRHGLGGLSPERVRRRLLGGAWAGARPDPWVAAGLLTAILPRTPACLAAEAACDHLLGALRLGLPAGEAATRCWAAARALGPPGTVAVARWLEGLRPADPGALAPVRAAAGEVLARAGVRPLPAAPRPPAQLVLAR